MLQYLTLVHRVGGIQVKSAELLGQEMVTRNEPVFAKDSPLAAAKAVQGLRAVFDEVRLCCVAVDMAVMLFLIADVSGSSACG